MSTKYLYIFEEKKKENNYNFNSLLNFSFHFYPPVKDFNDLGRQYEIYNNKKNLPNFLNNGMNEENKTDSEEDIYEVNNDFFESLLGKNNQYLDKEKKIKTISKIIRRSKLMEKLEKEYNSSCPETDLGELSTMCAKNILFMELKKGRILFKIGDKGDRFYFILSGKITILKPRKFLIKMNLQEYISYLFLLLKEKEDYLFNEIILNNCTQMPITSVDEIKILYKIFFKMTLKLNIENGNIDNNRCLKVFFERNYQSFSEYNIDMKNLEILETIKLTRAGKRKWADYLLDKCILTKGDLRTYERYKEYNEKKNIICYVYDSFLYLGPGFFFGDSALEERVNKRNATIRAEEDSVLGFLKSVDYLNMIAPQRKIEKMKEIYFLVNNFFFKNIKVSIFEKNLFHLFTLNESTRGTKLFSCNTKPKYLFFLKGGNLSLTLDCSIIDINNIIEKICNHVLEKYSEELIQKNIITKEIITILKGYIENDQVLSNLKNYSKEFIREVNKKRTFQITVFNGVETIGLEENFLEIPYITNATVTSEKIIYYKIETEKIKTILLENHHINYTYIKSSINKILSLIERLQNLKQNYITISKMRHENPNSFRTKNLPSLKNISHNGQYSNLLQNSSSSKISIKKVNFSRNVVPVKDSKQKEKEFKILSYSENKGNKAEKGDIPNGQDNIDIYTNILNYKSPLIQNPYMNNNLFQTILLDTRIGNKINNGKDICLTHRKNKIIKNNINNNVNINNNNSKYMDYLNSFQKSKRNDVINIKIFKNKYNQNEENDKCQEILKNNRVDKTCDLIKIGDKSVTFDKLKRKIRNSECKINNIRKKLLQIIQSNNYLENQKGSNNNIFQKEINSNASFESEPNSFEKDNYQINLKRRKSPVFRKSQEIKNFHLSFVPLLNMKEEKEKEKEKENSKIKIHTNGNTIDKDNEYISLKINKSNTSKDILKIPKKNLLKNNSFNFKNKKLFLQKFLFNNKRASKNNIFNKNNLKKPEDDNDSNRKQLINNIEFSFNNINSINDKKKLPSIILKKINLNNSNELKTGKYINHKEFMPEIIKNFYNDKKMKGYVSLIPNKESNTLFLRKYHKKYNQNEQNNSNNKK